MKIKTCKERDKERREIKEKTCNWIYNEENGQINKDKLICKWTGKDRKRCAGGKKINNREKYVTECINEENGYINKEKLICKWIGNVGRVNNDARRVSK